MSSNLSSYFEKTGIRARYEPAPIAAPGEAGALIDRLEQVEKSLGIAPPIPVVITETVDSKTGDYVITGEPEGAADGK